MKFVMTAVIPHTLEKLSLHNSQAIFFSMSLAHYKPALPSQLAAICYELVILWLSNVLSCKLRFENDITFCIALIDLVWERIIEFAS